MTAKEELMQYIDAQGRVEEALEEYRKYQERATKMTSIISDMPMNRGKSDKVGDNVPAMADLDNEYLNRWIEAEKKRLYIVERIDGINNSLYREVLKYKYVEGLKIEEIACRKDKSYDRIKHIHREALEQYRKKYNLEKEENSTKTPLQ
jgi:DNA-directed RNA polymerase specialized sigma24 family protein